MGLGDGVDWAAALVDVDVVIHCAARVHVMHDAARDPLSEFRRVNVNGTLALASQALAAGVRRFVFVSSIKVNGERNVQGRAFCADDAPAPVDPYGVSKLEAEQGLLRLAGETGLEVVVVRPPLVYGPGVKANFLRMLNWLQRGVPLPFGSLNNRRSFVAVDNLADLLIVCCRSGAAAGQVFLASDGDDLSTAELLRRLGKAIGRPARLVPVPATWLDAAFGLLGKQELAQRLCGSLRVDVEKTRQLLGWSPVIGVDEALARTASHYLTQRRRNPRRQDSAH